MKKAFSLIELLISLIIISLVSAVFAPIITKKLLARNLTVAGNLNVPYDSKAFTEDTEWIVPDGIKKIRVYLTGAGGSGASAAPRLTEHFASLPALNNEVLTLLNAGTYNFTTVPTSANYKAPSLPSGCSGNWSITSGGTIAPNAKLNNYLANTTVRLSKVTACGAGGGMGGGIRQCAGGGCNGGTGGYFANQPLNITNTAPNIGLKIGFGGSGFYDGCNFCYGQSGYPGGIGGSNGASGASCTTSKSNINCACGAGGGGGGSTAILNSGIIIFEAPGGGGGGGGAGSSTDGCISYGGAGGSGGGANSGSGGNPASCWSEYNCSPGAGASGYVAGYTGARQNESDNNGGTGGGGIGSNLAKIFNANNCSGATYIQSAKIYSIAKPGAMQLTYSIDALPNALKCQYTLPPYGSGGGGAGQVWIGEINVNEGQKLSIKIGKGGAKQTISASNGFDGGTTSINLNSTILAQALGGKGGKYSSTTTGAGGTGGGLKIQKNWLNISSASGASGSNGTTSGMGGKGGSTYSNSNTFFQGAKGGDHGEDAISTSYGTGGGGGGSSASNPTFWGQGGKGADGFAYIEWKR